MKYIRTKDGRIYELQETEDGEKYLIRTGELIPMWNTEAYEILAQADTIDELCDRFVLIDRNEYESPIDEELIGKRYEAMFDEFKFRLSEGSLIKKMSFYGAIWTDKGLIYVAKMNGEGKFELL